MRAELLNLGNAAVAKWGGHTKRRSVDALLKVLRLQMTKAAPPKK